MMKRAVKKILEVAGFELRRVNNNDNNNNQFEPKKEDRFKWIRNLDIKTAHLDGIPALSTALWDG
jgi:hypothetical protein